MTNDLEQLLEHLKVMYKSVESEQSKEKVKRWGLAVKESIRLWQRPLETVEERKEAVQQIFLNEEK